jgi:hypothetical protein
MKGEIRMSEGEDKGGGKRPMYGWRREKKEMQIYHPFVLNLGRIDTTARKKDEIFSLSYRLSPLSKSRHISLFFIFVRALFLYVFFSCLVLIFFTLSDLDTFLDAILDMML